MDLTSLSSNLPGSSSRQNRNKHSSPPPPHTTADGSSEEQLLQAFKSAATSVTLLYKSSASLISSSRTDGYHDALSEVLEVIDNESAYDDPTLALSRIRDWVIDRRHECKPGQGGSVPPQPREMSSEADVEDERLRHENTKREEDERLAHSRLNEEQYPKPNLLVTEIPASHPFTFQPTTATPTYPLGSDNTVTSDTLHSSVEVPSTNIFTFNAPPNNTRLASTSHKVPLPSRVVNSSLGAGAGSKRRSQYMDFFDIGGLGSFNPNNGSNGPGSGGYSYGNGAPKRGRFT